MPDFSTRVRRPRPQSSDVLSLAAGLAALTLSAYLASSAWADLRRARTVLEAEGREAASLREKLRVLGSGRGSIGSGLTGQILASADAPPPRVLGELTALLPPDVRLDELTLNYGSRLNVEARVVARRPESYDLFLRRLGESPAFEAIMPGAETRQSEIRTSVRMTYLPEGTR